MPETARLTAISAYRRAAMANVSANWRRTSQHGLTPRIICLSGFGECTFALHSDSVPSGHPESNPQAARGQPSDTSEPDCIAPVHFAPCLRWPHSAFCFCDLEQLGKAGKTERRYRRRFRHWLRNRRNYKLYTSTAPSPRTLTAMTRSPSTFTTFPSKALRLAPVRVLRCESRFKKI